MVAAANVRSTLEPRVEVTQELSGPGFLIHVYLRGRGSQLWGNRRSCLRAIAGEFRVLVQTSAGIPAL